MASAAQVVANIDNAMHSTGPRTDAGKASSSINALKHGLTAQTILLSGEDEAAYHSMCAAIFKTWAPYNETEIQLVQQLCDTQWRLNRCARLEAGALSGEVPDFKALDTISRHEARLKRIYSATLKEAREMIEIRLGNQAQLMRQVMIVRRADRLKERPTNPQELGFDFTVQEIDVNINREDAILRARKIVSQAADFSK